MLARTHFADLELSTLMLGTVQFGLPYGIANQSGQPSYKTVLDILACALEGGVNCLDTAAGYGQSEEVLGRALSEMAVVDQVTVVTKVVHMAPEYPSQHVADRIVEQSVMNSLKRLGLEQLAICLFHTEVDFRYIESLLKLKDKGLVAHVGASVMTPEATRKILASRCAEAVQVPANVLDHRFIDAGVFDDAKRSGAALFVRSVYLQGLILMPEGQILPELREVIPHRRRLESLASEAGVTLAELAARYALTIDGSTCALVGVDSVEQLRDNIALFSKGPLPEDLMTAVAEAIPNLPESILMPNRWSKRMPDPQVAQR